MRRAVVLALFAALLALAPAAGASPFPSVSCVGTLPAGAYFHVIVPGVGVTCAAERGIVITGGLEIGGSTFILGRENSAGLTGIISGNMQVPGAQIHHARLIGPVSVALGGVSTSLTNNEIEGSLRSDFFQGPTLRIANNTVTGSVRISRTGWNPYGPPVTSVVISGNTIMGNLICGLGGAVNTPLPTLGGGPPNIVFGMKLGECAGL